MTTRESLTAAAIIASIIGLAVTLITPCDPTTGGPSVLQACGMFMCLFGAAMAHALAAPVPQQPQRARIPAPRRPGKYAPRVQLRKA